MVDENSKDTEEGFDAAQAAAEFAAAMAGDPATSDTESNTEADAGTGTGTDKDNYTAILEDEVEALGRALADKDKAIEAAQEQTKAAQDKAKAASAEIDRVRARIQRDADRTIDRKHRSVLSSFLDVADDLDRAIQQMSTHDVAPAVAQGVKMVRDKLHTTLTQHRARHRPSLGQPFDPAHHEAVGIVPASEDAPAGTIVEVLQEGYELDDQPLRAARVVVAKE